MGISHNLKIITGIQRKQNLELQRNLFQSLIFSKSVQQYFIIVYPISYFSRNVHTNMKNHFLSCMILFRGVIYLPQCIIICSKNLSHAHKLRRYQIFLLDCTTYLYQYIFICTNQLPQAKYFYFFAQKYCKYFHIELFEKYRYNIQK